MKKLIQNAVALTLVLATFVGILTFVAPSAEAASTAQGLVTSRLGLIVREEPSSNSRQIGFLDRGAIVTLNAATNGWGRLANGGWVNLNFIARQDAGLRDVSVVAPNTGAINVRVGPSTSYRISGELLDGMRVSIFATSNNWGETSVGWISLANTRNYSPGNAVGASIQAGLDRISSGGNSTALSGGWQWPMNNFTITADFQHRTSNPPAQGRTHHVGIDLVSSDMRIFAAGRGVVVQAGWNDANGNFVTIRHTLENGQSVYSFYSHLRDSTRHLVNQTVNRGQQIGVMGNTGRRSFGEHLHFSISNSPGSSGDLVGWAAPGANNRASHGNITFFNPRFVIQNNRLP